LLERCDGFTSVLPQARNAAQKKQEKAELEIKKVAHKLERMEKENAGAEKLIGNFLKKYPWIESVCKIWRLPCGHNA
jgi:hypothetical protein